jgi:hypothetical protein
MSRQPYVNDPGESEFTGDGQLYSNPDTAAGVGVVPPGQGADLIAWYWTDPADPTSAPEPGNANIGDDRINRNH